MLKSYPDGNVRVFFLLHTNRKGKAALTKADAQMWDNFAKWAPHGQTLADGKKQGSALYFRRQKSANMVLKKGFEVFKLNSKDYKADVAEALAAP